MREGGEEVSGGTQTVKMFNGYFCSMNPLCLAILASPHSTFVRIFQNALRISCKFRCPGNRTGNSARADLISFPF